jgi:5-methylcytosine-specific restriction endonuclease McrA
MAYKDPEKARAYLRERYLRRKTEALNRLGGRCARCGATRDLQVDHIDRAEKTMPFSRMYVVNREQFEAELSKCQLLCQDCHQKKSIEEVGFNSRETHGTYACYRYSGCRCEDCKRANRDKSRAYRAKIKGE